MHSKDIATVRISQIWCNLRKTDLLHFFNRNKLLAREGISLCPSASAQDASLVATVTFNSPSDLDVDLITPLSLLWIFTYDVAKNVSHPDR